MGCILTVEEKKSRSIDYQLRKDGNYAKNETKLLLLGPGESGKSTIFKQMKIIQDDGGFTTEERLEYRYIIYGNCISQMKVLVMHAVKCEIKPLSQNEESFDRISKITPGGNSWTNEVANDIKALWADENIQKVYEMRDKSFQLNDSAAYFFQNITRFSSEDYIPNQDDVLRSRVRTTGIQEANFKFHDIEFRMLDVGGQRSERRKWIHCFDSVTAVIFCVAMSEYDQSLREDESQNRMKESLLLFDEIINSHWFSNTAFILFFNKVDLFREKVVKVDLGEYFPAYKGGLNFENGSMFVKRMFLDQCHNSQMIFPHFTCAIDTQNIQFVFQAVRETLLMHVLGNLGWGLQN
ncbi:G-protein subunit alpha 5 [Heterostelium album PN500]|uniref:G-protein subunit alpha 5 n=1 Tax=Heterostelium pallidum (strain ATCC 26659 / Pp 5 / PN500) TaxID=670386 RepID=D3BI33_HETP5|nr:G-protein subunit alpha 5 [Heterostelium album PN500]EFA78933.1 G-protein subunit alpha 5 [Heterostelium album PN500]|eukprot:XP_020431057.1 G-protein subunit alpha 5 [Heterostelium album PN500]